MSNGNAAQLAPSTKNLKRLFALRNIEIAGQILAVLGVRYGLDISLPLVPMLVVTAILAAANALTWWRLRKPWPVADAEFFGQLLADVLALTALLFFSGGSTNPFVSLYLLPLTIAAAVLPARYTWAMAVLTVACYTLLLFVYIPLPPPGEICSTEATGHMHLGGEDDFGRHVLGMWFNFVLSAGLISFFVVKMAGSIRERDRQLAEAREQSLRDERLVALGTLAAGAAHELGTPLSTIAVIARELEQEHAGDPELSESFALLRGQVESCKRILSNMLASAGQTRAENAESLPADAFLGKLLDKWQLMRPEVSVHAGLHGPQPAPGIVADETLSQAVMNLLNNAADVSPRDVEIEGRWDAHELTLEICDRGTGLTPEVASRAGEAFFTTKGPGEGLGLGLFLTNATIERFGGKVQMFNREGSGACVRVILPLAQLAAKELKS